VKDSNFGFFHPGKGEPRARQIDAVGVGFIVFKEDEGIGYLFRFTA